MQQEEAEVTNAGYRPGHHHAPGEPCHADVALYPILPISTFGIGTDRTRRLEPDRRVARLVRGAGR